MFSVHVENATDLEDPTSMAWTSVFQHAESIVSVKVQVKLWVLPKYRMRLTRCSFSTPGLTSFLGKQSW